MPGPTGAQKEEKKNGRKMLKHSFADTCVYTIVVCSKWSGLLRHRVEPFKPNCLGGITGQTNKQTNKIQLRIIVRLRRVCSFVRLPTVGL